MLAFTDASIFQQTRQPKEIRCLLCSDGISKLPVLPVQHVTDLSRLSVSAGQSLQSKILLDKLAGSHTAVIGTTNEKLQAASD